MSEPVSESEIPELINSLKRREFYGKLSVEFNRGQAKLIRIEETKLIHGENHNDKSSF